MKPWGWLPLLKSQKVAPHRKQLVRKKAFLQEALLGPMIEAHPSGELLPSPAHFLLKSSAGQEGSNSDFLLKWSFLQLQVESGPCWPLLPSVEDNVPHSAHGPTKDSRGGPVGRVSAKTILRSSNCQIFKQDSGLFLCLSGYCRRTTWERAAK